jgi:hypothetical protein
MAKNKSEPSKMVRVVFPHKEEGWYVFSEYEIDESVLKEQGTLISKTNPDIFAIFKDQLLWKVRDILGL